MHISNYGRQVYFCSVIVLCGCSNASKWPANLQKLVLGASEIAIIEVYGIPSGTGMTQTDAVYVSSARMVTPFKGNLPKTFVLNSQSSPGDTGFISKTPLHNQQYLAFLIKDGNEYRPANPYGLLYQKEERITGV